KLVSHLGGNAFISEQNDSPEIKARLKGFDFETGEHSESVFDSDLIIISPGISKKTEVVKSVKDKKIPIVSEIEFASWFATSPIIGITGSNGKTTTSYLAHSIFRNAGYQSKLGGNMGHPFSTIVLDEIINPVLDSVIILEISSFQLEDIFFLSPILAIILNITPDHLNRYDSLEHYARTKIRIAQNLSEKGALIFNQKDRMIDGLIREFDNIVKIPYLSETESCIFTATDDGIYRGKQLLIPASSIHLKGLHNFENILAAITAAHWFGIKLHYIIDAVTNFHNIRHRLELVGEIDGVRFYNDSKATNTASVIAALTSFSENIVLILGGQSKGKSDISELIPHMKNRVRQIFCYGDAGTELLAQVEEFFNAEFVWDFTSCMEKVFENLKTGDTVLLSPACASFDQFERFEARGDRFTALVNQFNGIRS
ncbi:MAG: UDP-N-acetylmuramoyl-L-alanine--D-glutamate ligase, partial [Fidelibacterota bacterium]